MKTLPLLLLVVALSLSGCGKPVPEKHAPEAIRVKVIALQREKISLPVSAGGLVMPAEEVKLSFKTGGLISEIRVNEGQRVIKGDVLAVLNAAEIEAASAQYREGYEKAVRDYTRAKKLFTDSVATLEQLQNAETAVNMSKAAMEAAAFNLRHTRIMAPENGVILKKLAEKSEMIGPGYPILVLGTSNQGWKIRTGLADRDFVRIQTGDSAAVTLDAYPGVHFRARVSRVSEAANPLTGTYEIELDLLAPGRKMAAGLVANLEIFPRQEETFIRLPVQALASADASQGTIFIVTDSMVARKTQVRIFQIYQSYVALYDDPNLTGRAVTEGAAYLSDGSRVTLVP